MSKPSGVSNGGWQGIDWGHLLLLSIMAGIVLAYWLDARGTSLNLSNLLLVQPGSLLALGLVLAALPQAFRRPTVQDDPSQERESGIGRIMALAGTFGAMTLLLERIGFDVATFLFMVVALRVCGERRWWVLILYSLVFTALIIYGYGALVPFPFPLTLL
jgi:hypothetical protein